MGTADEMGREKHWNDVYATKGDNVSWYQPSVGRPVDIVRSLDIPAGSTAIDVGAGASTFPDALLEQGFAKVTVADLSQVALHTIRNRLSARPSNLQFLVGDITKLELPENTYDLWHDRAVFHFINEQSQREAYIRQVLRALRPGGHIVVATLPMGFTKSSRRTHFKSSLTLGRVSRAFPCARSFI